MRVNGKKPKSLLRALFPRTAARFLALWLLAMLLLTVRELDAQRERLESAVDGAADRALENCRMVLEGDYDDAVKPAQLEARLSAYYSYGAVAVFRLPSAFGLGECRSQLTSGSFALPGTGVYDHYLLFDPVLTDAEHLALARRLRENRELLYFAGTAGGVTGGLLAALLLTGGILLGILGLVGVGVNYPIYKKLLRSGKEKYAFEIVQLAREISEGAE